MEGYGSSTWDEVSHVIWVSPYISIMKGMDGLPLIGYNHCGIITRGTFYIYAGQ